MYKQKPNEAVDMLLAMFKRNPEESEDMLLAMNAMNPNLTKEYLEIVESKRRSGSAAPAENET